MPRTRDIKLAKDWRGRKAGDVLTVTDPEYVEALDAQVVRKTYVDPVPGVKKHRLSAAPAKKTTAKRAAKKTTARKSAATTPTPTGDEK